MAPRETAIDQHRKVPKYDFIRRGADDAHVVWVLHCQDRHPSDGKRWKSTNGNEMHPIKRDEHKSGRNGLDSYGSTTNAPIGFPLIVVSGKSDTVVGTLAVQEKPRLYFDFRREWGEVG